MARQPPTWSPASTRPGQQPPTGLEGACDDGYRTAIEIEGWNSSQAWPRMLLVGMQP